MKKSKIRARDRSFQLVDVAVLVSRWNRDFVVTNATTKVLYLLERPVAEHWLDAGAHAA